MLYFFLLVGVMKVLFWCLLILTNTWDENVGRTYEDDDSRV